MRRRRRSQAGASSTPAGRALQGFCPCRGGLPPHSPLTTLPQILVQISKHKYRYNYKYKYKCIFSSLAGFCSQALPLHDTDLVCELYGKKYRMTWNICVTKPKNIFVTKPKEILLQQSQKESGTGKGKVQLPPSVASPEERGREGRKVLLSCF